MPYPGWESSPARVSVDHAILEVMTTRPVGWSIRAFFFALVGVLTFIVQPPGATAEKAQFVAGTSWPAWACWRGHWSTCPRVRRGIAPACCR